MKSPVDDTLGFSFGKSLLKRIEHIAAHSLLSKVDDCRGAPMGSCNRAGLE